MDLQSFVLKKEGGMVCCGLNLFGLKTGTCGRHCNGPSRSIKEGNLLSSWGIVNLSRTLFVELCFLQWTNLIRDLTVASDKYVQDEFVIITVLKYEFKR